MKSEILIYDLDLDYKDIQYCIQYTNILILYETRDERLLYELILQ